MDQARVKAVVLSKSRLRDRDEEEVRGYRDALKLIHEQGRSDALSWPSVLSAKSQARFPSA